MNFTELVRRTYWRVLRMFGSERTSWNKQYESGVWSSGRRSPKTVALMAQYTAGGKLVEFGCGEGELPHLLPAGSFSDYLGMDIADVAVTRARERAAQAGLSKVRFEQADMSQWAGAQGISAILAEECLYYLKPEQIEVFLSRALASLVPGGRIVVAVHSPVKHARTLKFRQVCLVEQELREGERAYLVLAPRA